jgi:hypothetical protein
MGTLRIYRHPDCERCARIVRVHHRFDWLRRIEDTTQPPPGRRAPRRGEILVRDLDTGRWLEGVAAVHAICRAVPCYAPLRLLLRVPALARRADADARGLRGACDPSDPGACQE